MDEGDTEVDDASARANQVVQCSEGHMLQPGYLYYVANEPLLLSPCMPAKTLSNRCIEFAQLLLDREKR